MEQTNGSRSLRKTTIEYIDQDGLELTESHPPVCQDGDGRCAPSYQDKEGIFKAFQYQELRHP